MSEGRSQRWAVVGAVLAALLLAGAGCGGNDGPMPSAFCAEYQRRQDEGQFRCLGGVGTAPESTPVGCSLLDASLAAGRIGFEPSAADSCLAALDRSFDVRCVSYLPCLATVVRGLVVDGSACTHGFECRPGSECVAPANACGPRVCRPSWLPPGSPCHRNVQGVPQCVLGTICVGDDSNSTCIDQPPGRTCRSDGECIYFAERCDPDYDLCKPRLAVGAFCGSYPDACKKLALCDVATKTCAAAGARVGDTCGTDSFCWKGRCDSVANFAAPGKCLANPGAGAPCRNEAECESGVCENGACVACPP